MQSPQFSHSDLDQIIFESSASSPFPCSLKKKNNRKPGVNWTEEEDNKLLQAVDRYGTSRWVEIAEFVGTRTRKQCRERYVNHVCPSIDNSGWTSEEDSIILKGHKELDNKWSEISKLLKGRTARAVRNRYYSIISKINSSKTCFVPTTVTYTVTYGGKPWELSYN